MFLRKTVSPMNILPYSLYFDSLILYVLSFFIFSSCSVAFIMPLFVNDLLQNFKLLSSLSIIDAGVNSVA